MFKEEKGQALLIVVLVMVIALTVGLSIASKTITNLRTSTEEANSQKALSAAEAGVEQAIKTNASILTQNLSNNTSYKTDVTGVSGTNFLMNGGNPVQQDNGADLWLSDYSPDSTKIYLNPWSGNLTIKWGTTSDPCLSPAIEVLIVSGTKASPTSTRYAFDGCAARSSSNHFSTQVTLTRSTINGKDLYFQNTVPISVSSGLLGRVIPVYQNGAIGIIGSVALPSQGSTITSTGTSGNTLRKVNVFQGYPEIPSEFFQYGLFSP
ncbi:MAG TPA: pilus assembly PilX N-terminal domain-containing protein [Patescibacteria group bacterium]|nr:pilus assembly PilX N-terminal domain-containing protein [Patescibacteria group bacterium]